MKQDLKNLMREIEITQSALQTERDKLWKLAGYPYMVMGEAHVVEDSIILVPLGDTPPEPKLGLAPGSFPVTIEEALATMHPDDLQPFQLAVARSLTSGDPFDMNYRLSDGHGGWRWIEGRAESVEVSDGSHVGWVFINRDSTAEHETEQILRHSICKLEASRFEQKSEKDKLWRLAANAFSLLAEIHISANGMEMEFFGDRRPEEKIGLRPGSIPKTIEELMLMIHPDDVTGFQQKLSHSVASGEQFRMIYRLSDGYGGWRWLDVRAFSLGEVNNQHVNWLADNKDVTELKETEEELRKSVAELQQLKTQMQAENIYLREEVDRGGWHTDIVGRSAPMARILEQMELVAATSATVLISGETGTGKELVARSIHQLSDRRNKLFVAMNCAALSNTLVESELFGHEKGAFTGAIARRVGRFEQADGGTLFLDEVGELPLEVQAKMLRVLQSGEFERVGGEQPQKAYVRVIAASNRNLEQLVQNGEFRNDLYHRLAIFPIHLPPLRERREDIPLLTAYLATRKAQQLGRKIESISPKSIDRLSAYDWPGNVRELENVLERAIILSPGTILRQEAIRLGSTSPVKASKLPDRPDDTPAIRVNEPLQKVEREHILRVCQTTGWKIKGPHGAAAQLGINPGTLYSRMKKLGIQRPKCHHQRSGD
jgi:DNA-binding NtrC family response regulator